MIDQVALRRDDELAVSLALPDVLGGNAVKLFIGNLVQFEHVDLIHQGLALREFYAKLFHSHGRSLRKRLDKLADVDPCLLGDSCRFPTRSGCRNEY